MKVHRTLPGRVVAERAGISYRQLDHWHRSGLYPDVPAGAGPGSRRLWAPRHIAVTALWASLHGLGAGLHTCAPMARWASKLEGPWTGLLVVAAPEQDPRRCYRDGRLRMPEADWTVQAGLGEIPLGGAWVVDLAWCWAHAQLTGRLRAAAG